jgi:hypothetical protein
VHRFGHRVESMWRHHALTTSLVLGSVVLLVVLGMQALAGLIV